MLRRRIVQLTSLILLHASWGPEAKWLCNPVLSCHSCALSWFACPVGIFVHYSGWHLFPFLALGTVLLLGILFGRLLCGWVCPFGFIQDLLHKIPSHKFDLPEWAGSLKYLVLVLGVVALPFLFGADTWYSFCRICPAAALQVTIPNAITSGMQWSLATLIKLSVLAAVIIFAIVSSRSFCKTLCPIGALLAPLNYLSLWFVGVPTSACANCGKCDRVCPVDGDPSGRIKTGTPANRTAECIVCHDCQKVCPLKGRAPKAGV